MFPYLDLINSVANNKSRKKRYLTIELNLKHEISFKIIIQKLEDIMIVP